jgi:hypothetical protein
VAWDGTEFLVAWPDGRGASLDDKPAVYASRVGLNGDPLDPGGLAIAAGESYGGSPQVIANGDGFLVLWVGFWAPSSSFGLFATRVDDTGEVHQPILVTTTGGGSFRVAWNGSTYLAVWPQVVSVVDKDIYGIRIGVDGHALGDPFVVASAPLDQVSPAVASNGADFLVAWMDWRNQGTTGWDIYGTRITGDGTVLDPSGIAISRAANEQGSPRVASDRSDFLVSWTDYRKGTDSDVYVGRITAGGSAPDGDGLAVASTASYEETGHLLWTGTRYFATWMVFQAELRGAELNPIGDVVADSEHGIMPLSDDREIGDLARSGNGYLLTSWVAMFRAPQEIRTVPLTEDGLLATDQETVLTSQANEQQAPAIAWNGSLSLIAWQEPVGPDDYDVYASRMLADGTFLDGRGIAIATGPGLQWHPAVASNGTDFVVIWRQSGNVYAADVTEGGDVTQIGQIATGCECGESDRPTISTGAGAGYLVAAEDPSLGIRVRPLDPSGQPTGPIVDVSGAASGKQPSLAWNGESFLVSWFVDLFGIGRVVRATRLDTHGNALDVEPIEIASDTGSITGPAVAAGGSAFFVVWDDDRNNGSEVTNDLYGARVSSSGSALDPDGIPVAVAPGVQASPVMTFDGKNFFVAWEDYRNRDCTFPDCNPDQVLAARVQPTGHVVDPAGLDVAPTTTLETDPGLAQAGSQQVALTYQRLAPERPYGGASRVFVRTVQEYAIAAPTMTAPSSRFQRGTSFHVAWKPASGGVGSVSYVVAERSARLQGTFGSFATWRGDVPRTDLMFRASPETTYCFRVKARDSMATTSAWSAERCTNVPLDDRGLTASGGWRRQNGRAFYQRTYSESSKRGAVLSRTSVTADRLAILASTCQSCGRIRVTFGGAPVGAFDLRSSRKSTSQLFILHRFAHTRSGTVRITVLSQDKRVRIDALGAFRAPR